MTTATLSAPPKPRTAFRFACALVAVTVWRMWFVQRLPLSGDEAYHWEWSRHLALGYYDHPGLFAYAIAASCRLLGTSELAVRLPAVLAGSLTAWALFALTRRLARDAGLDEARATRAGLWAGILFLVVPVFAVFSHYMTGDPLLFLFWTVTLHAVWAAFHSERVGPWLLVGLLLGLGIQAKLLMLAILPSVGLFVLLSRSDRRWLLSFKPLLALLIAALIVSPFVWWNSRHDWDTFQFTMGRHTRKFSLVTSLELVASQAIAFSPVVLVGMVWCVVRVLRTRPAGAARPWWFATCAFAVPLLTFATTSLTQRIGIHWPAMSGLAGIVLVALGWEAARGTPREAAVPRWRAWSVGVALAMVVVIHVVLVVPPQWITGLSISYSGRPDMISTDKHREIYGWEEFGARLGQIRAEMLAAQGPDGKGVFLMGPQYGVVALAGFYAPGRPPTRLWDRPIMHGQNYKYWDDYTRLQGQDAVFFTKKENLLVEHRALLARHFRSVGPPERLVVEHDGTELRSFWFVRCRGFDGVVPQFE